MNATNPYAPPRGAVQDVADPHARADLAERITRLVAAILDGLIFFAMCYLPFAVVMLSTGSFANSESAAANGPILGFGAVLSLVGFVVWIWLTVRNVARNGQTIAKKMLGIKVVRTDGSPASLGRIFWLRNVVNTLLGIIPLYGLIDVLLIFGAERQCIHDKIADTIVVKA
jgi:uncharacterized RDD family membrane protein YckC